MVKTSALVAFLAISGASAFAPAPASSQQSTSLEMKNSPFSKFVATASVASAILLSSAAPDAQAITGDFDFGSDNVIAARSGGRAGGRSSASSMRSPPPSSRPTTVNNIQRTTVIQQQPAVVAAPVMASPVVVAPVVSPFGSPFGVGYGALGVVNAIGNEMREGRQEAEIRREREELQESKQRQFMLEQRLNQMEQSQATTNAVNAALAGAR